MGANNLCSPVAASLAHPGAARQVLLASDGEDASTPELIRLIAKASGVHPRLVPFPVPLLHFAARLMGREAEMLRLTGSLLIDSSRTRRLLGWRPPLRLREGIRQAITGEQPGRV